jgi:hypothetical protein
MHLDTPTKINKYGNCPCCEKSWDGGSIAEYLFQQKTSGVPYWAEKPDHIILEIVKDDYGSQYARYSRLEITSDAVKCPDCKHIFPIATTTIDHSHRNEILPEEIWNDRNAEAVKKHILSKQILDVADKLEHDGSHQSLADKLRAIYESKENYLVIYDVADDLEQLGEDKLAEKLRNIFKALNIAFEYINSDGGGK